MDLSPHLGDAHCVGGRLRPLPEVGTWLITALTDSPHFITLITNLSPPSFLCCFLKFCLFDIQFFLNFISRISRDMHICPEGAIQSFTEVGETFVDSVCDCVILD